MGLHASIPRRPGRGRIELKLDLLRHMSGVLPLAHFLANRVSGVVGSISFTHPNLLGGSEKLNVLLEKGLIDFNFLVNYTRPSSGAAGRQSITIQNSLAPATAVHGWPAINSTDSWYAGVRVHRLTAGFDRSWSLKQNWRRTAGIRIEQVGAVGDHDRSIYADLYGCPITFSGNPYDKMLVAKLETEYMDSNDYNFTQLNYQLEQGLPILPGWLLFNRLKFHAKQGVKLGPAFGLTSVSGGTVIGDLAPHEAFPIGGFNSVRGYGEGAVGSGRSFIVASSELSFPL